jgi:hypothetical protein
VRLRYQPSRSPARFWLATAVLLWVLVKLPQEYWTHVEQGDLSEATADHPVIGVVCVSVVLCLGVALGLVRTRLPVPDRNWRIAADPLGSELDDAHTRHARRLRRRDVLWAELAETAALLALLAVVFASILPGITAGWPEVAAAAVALLRAPRHPDPVAQRRVQAACRAPLRARAAGVTGVFEGEGRSPFSRA